MQQINTTDSADPDDPWLTEVDTHITIKFYRTVQYGTTREHVHPECVGVASIIRQLTGQRTINRTIRELLRDLTQGHIQWEEVIAP